MSFIHEVLFAAIATVSVTTTRGMFFTGLWHQMLLVLLAGVDFGSVPVAKPTKIARILPSARVTMLYKKCVSFTVRGLLIFLNRLINSWGDHISMLFKPIEIVLPTSLKCLTRYIIKNNPPNAFTIYHQVFGPF